MKFLKNTKGQVAIFVVLIFQVLFILFAMTINIAMVSYDKINLQNSLDLAVYYGAKKQSEVLSAMAHINYQMRQNWKLLAWRYRIMGTLIQAKGGTNPNYWCPQNSKDGVAIDTTCENNPSKPQCQEAQNILNTVYGNNYCDARYFVCISHSLWKRGITTDNQNLCTKLEVYIPRIVDLKVTAGFMAEAHLAARGVDLLQRQVGLSCPKEGALNWLMTQFFITHFRLDQKDRKIMMEEIYNKTLKEGKDLDGESIFKGSAKVFCNNLNPANKKNLINFCNNYPEDKELISYNSFLGKDFEDVFQKLNVWPVLQFLKKKGSISSDDGQCDVNLDTHYRFMNLINYDDIFDKIKLALDDHSLESAMKPQVKNLFKFNSHQGFQKNTSDPDPMQELTLSFFKKKDEILYYGLKVEFDYKSDHQVFSLNLSPAIKFKASAFAKAFGGKFGPQPSESDPLIPVHHPKAPSSISANLNRLNSVLLQPNYSRFPGDRWGLIHKILHDNNSKWNFLNKHVVYPAKRVYTMENYFHLTLNQGTADDPLARHPNYNSNNFTRMMELMAVYPDLYDISYYSILGNYHQTYFQKICKLLGSNCNPSKRNQFQSTASKTRLVYVRGDFGWPDTETYLTQNQQRKAVELSIAPYFLNQNSNEINKTLIRNPGDNSQTATTLPNARLFGKINTGVSPPLSQGNLFYPWLANPLPDQLLSSWVSPHPLNYENYNNNFPDRFMNCSAGALEDMPVPSACASGGRSAYSVKLISCGTVKDFKDQPSNIDEYCPN
ncbi:MAG: pilus assembly protein TadG-related protein [Bdellovibrionaceae bacterium]|nr:pilus assembly protein TadG-related protein [Pseudobdellovibrionaceae bacterium]